MMIPSWKSTWPTTDNSLIASGRAHVLSPMIKREVGRRAFAATGAKYKSTAFRVAEEKPEAKVKRAAKTASDKDIPF
jgi:hypothetical protein